MSVLLASSSAFAFCFTEQSYSGIGSASAQCTDEGMVAGITIQQLFAGTVFAGQSYQYTVAATGHTSEVGGVLLDATGSVVIGDRGAASGLCPCNGSLPSAGVGARTFTCRSASAPVAFIRVFAE